LQQNERETLLHFEKVSTLAPPLPFGDSLCHRCAAPPKYVRTAASVFIRCPILAEKYPRQPVHACAAYRPPIAVTARLILRPIVDDDLDFLAALLGDAEVMRHYPAPLDRAGARAWLARVHERYARDGHGFWLAVDHTRGEPIGQIGLITQMVGGVAEPEVGYMVHRPYWRRGYAREAAAAVVDWALGRGHDHVISLIRPVNEPSQAVARSLGMRPTVHVEHAGLDHVVWRLDRDAWRPPATNGRDG
jgi:RimJ/RimL family protein N-acetyltransferase